MLAIAIVGMGLIAVIGTVLAGAALKEQSLERVSVVTANDADMIDSWFTRNIGYIDAVAADFSTMTDISPEALLPALVKHTENNEDFFSVYFGYPTGAGVFNDEWVPDSDWIATERDWYKDAAAAPGKVNISDLYVDAETGNLCLTFSEAVIRDGEIAGVAAIDIFTTVLGDIVSNATVGKDSYAFMTDSAGNIITHHNASYDPTIDKDENIVYQNIASVDNKNYAVLRNADIIGGSIELRDPNGVLYSYTASVIPSTGWILYTAIPMSVVNAAIDHQILISAIIFVAVLLVAILLIYFSLRALITRPVKDVTKAADLLANGETGVSLDGKYVGEIAVLAQAFRGMETFNRQQAEWLECIAEGDLAVEVVPRGESDRIGNAIHNMLTKLNDMFSDINESTHQVTNGSMQIASGAQTLAQGSTEQSASVEDLSKAISDIAEKTKTNAQKAEKASELADTIRGNAEKGSHQMDEMISAVGKINQSSQNIGKVIKVIDDIAFQTNILALNAAVEAARAGQHGKGFAVVAEEVRNLASKSAEAARDTGSMIQDSIEKAELGSRIANNTAASLSDIVSGINESTQLISEITVLSEEQSLEIEQINSGIMQVSQVIQQNSATAEESAAAAEEMSSQASLLQEMVAHFKLSGGNTTRNLPSHRYR